jgi:hypothetical protein
LIKTAEPEKAKQIVAKAKAEKKLKTTKSGGETLL